MVFSLTMSLRTRWVKLDTSIPSDPDNVSASRLCYFFGSPPGSIPRIKPSDPDQRFIPFPDFGQSQSFATTDGNSYYHGLQTRVEKQFAHGLNFLATYTYSKTRTDAGDLLNGGSGQGYRAPNFPDFGIHGDYGLASFDIRHVFHLSGGYELPFGKGRRFLSDSSGVANMLAGGWSVQFIATLQGGQPITLPCANGTASGTGCYDFTVAGQDPHLASIATHKGTVELDWQCLRVHAALPT